MKSAALRMTEQKQERAGALADRLLEGAGALAAFASGLTPEQWNTRLPRDGRKVGVVVHHVASVYPVEIELAQAVTKGEPVTGVTAADIDAMNAAHAKDFENVTKHETLELLQRNSAAAAEAIRAFSADDLDCAVPVSLYSNATVTSQFLLEDHAVRHSYHHLERIRKALSS